MLSGSIAVPVPDHAFGLTFAVNSSNLPALSYNITHLKKFSTFVLDM